MNICDRRFIYNPRTDVLAHFRGLGWQPPERHAEEVESEERRHGAFRAMKRLQAAELKRNGANSNVTWITTRRRA